VSNVIALAAAKIYQQDKLILDQVQLELAAQSFAYLIGKTGSGKSSLLKTLYAEIPLLEGDGEVCGYTLKGLKRKDIPFLRRKIGIVFQDFQLLTDRNVLDNLKFVLGATGWKDKKLIEQRALNCLQLVGIEQKANAFPHMLSGGEQQRVALARAFSNKPSILFADEPTGNLDEETGEKVIQLLFELNKDAGTTLVIISHDLELANRTQQILKLKGGKIITNEPTTSF
jgi:cell division transport system ATP-binding protein